MIPYRDLHHMSENQRIDAIGQRVMKGGVIAFITDADAGKAERYMLKLFVAYPLLELVDKTDGPTPGVVTVRVRRKAPGFTVAPPPPPQMNQIEKDTINGSGEN